MSDQHVCYDCERDFAAVCRKCSDDKVAALRAQLAAVENERDGLRMALEPTEKNVRAYEMAGFGNDTTPQDLEIQERIYARNKRKVEYVLDAIRALAGLTKEGK